MPVVAQGPSVAQVRDFAVTHRVRLFAGATIVIALATCLASAPGYQAVMWMLLGPVMAGGVVALASQVDWSEQINDCQTSFEQGLAKAEGKTGKYSRFFLTPLYRGSLWLWRATDGIGDAHVKAALRVGGIAYFWSVMIVVLVLAVWLIVGLMIAVFALAIVSWFMGGRRIVTSAASDFVVKGVGTRIHKGVFGPTDTRIDKKGDILKGRGVLSEERVGHIDEDGTITDAGLLGGQKTGRIDTDGNVYKSTGFGSEEWTGRIDETGNIVDGDDPFGEAKEA
jgi:hypothetical protein